MKNRLLGKVFLCFLVSLYLLGCRSYPCPTPDLTIGNTTEQVLHEPGERTLLPSLSWLQTISKIETLWEKNKVVIDSSVKAVYPIVVIEVESIFLETLTNTSDRLITMTIAVEKEALKAHDFPPEVAEDQGRKIGLHWKDLLEAEYHNLHMAIAISDMQQQWRSFRKSCSVTLQTENQELIEEKLSYIPSLQSLEVQKQVILLLIKACHQLAVTNEEIAIPSTEQLTIPYSY